MLTKEIHKEITTAKQTISKAEKRISELKDKLITNLLYEKANQTLPFNYSELFEEVRALRSEAEAAPQNLSETAASFVPSLFPALEGKGALVKAGTKINWNGALKLAATDLWDIEAYNPDNAPTLWKDITYYKGVRIIPEVITVTLAFSEGEQGYWKGELYTSLVNGNVYTPEQYSANWKNEGVIK